MNHSELLDAWRSASRQARFEREPYTVASMLNAAAATRRQLATYTWVERLTGNRPARATMYAETRQALVTEVRWHIAEARRIRITQ